MHAGRTLALKGTLKVESLAQSVNSLTHSYTIPIITASGLLKSPLLIVKKKTVALDPLSEELYIKPKILSLLLRSQKK